MNPIYHITSIDEWSRAQTTGLLRASSLASEGFIHCSTREQVIQTANRVFLGQKGLLLLTIDPGKVGVEIRYEVPHGVMGGERVQRYPHIYGLLEVDAIVQVLRFEPGEDGTFAMPDEPGRMP